MTSDPSPPSARTDDGFALYNPDHSDPTFGMEFAIEQIVEELAPDMPKKARMAVEQAIWDVFTPHLSTLEDKLEKAGEALEEIAFEKNDKPPRTEGELAKPSYAKYIPVDGPKAEEKPQEKCICAPEWLEWHTWHVANCPQHTATNCPYPRHKPYTGQYEESTVTPLKDKRCGHDLCICKLCGMSLDKEDVTTVYTKAEEQEFRRELLDTLEHELTKSQNLGLVSFIRLRKRFLNL